MVVGHEPLASLAILVQVAQGVWTCPEVLAAPGLHAGHFLEHAGERLGELVLAGAAGDALVHELLEVLELLLDLPELLLGLGPLERISPSWKP